VVDVGAAVVADEQPLEVVEPGEGALDHPPHAAEPRAVLGVAAGDLRRDPTLAQFPPLRPVVVGTVGGDSLGTTARPADASAHGRDGVHERDQLSDVVAIAARDRAGERDPSRLDQEVVLGAVSGSINRARARLGAPFFACT
jgi:hypothetical protein